MLSSVGDAFGGAATLGTGQLFSGTLSTTIEPDPPDGSNFGIIDANSSSGGMGWPSGDLAYIQDEIVATLLYTGSLSGVDEVATLYGTDGLTIVPEPSTALLLAAGLVGIALRRHRL